jgi:hypothetical protein
MSHIAPGNSVNILCSEHGFILMGGVLDRANEAVAECIEALKDSFRKKP